MIRMKVHKFHSLIHSVDALVNFIISVYLQFLFKINGIFIYYALSEKVVCLHSVGQTGLHHLFVRMV